MAASSDRHGSVARIMAWRRTCRGDDVSSRKGQARGLARTGAKSSTDAVDNFVDKHARGTRGVSIGAAWIGLLNF